jgi:hypothetical protein
MFCHPTANCFHRCLVLSNDDDNYNENNIPQDDSNTSFISSFFIGLSFTKGVGTMDITPSIQDFIYRVTCWIGKKADMEVKVSVFEQSQIPDFVFETKAEPSNIRGCTPAKATSKKSNVDKISISKIKRNLNNNNDENDNNDNDLYNGPSADFASFFEVQGNESPLRSKTNKQSNEINTNKTNEVINNHNDDNINVSTNDPVTEVDIPRSISPEIEKRSWSAAVKIGTIHDKTYTNNNNNNNNNNTNHKNDIKYNGNSKSNNNNNNNNNSTSKQHFPPAIHKME